MSEQARRTRIEDLAAVGEELSEEHLRLVSGASRKKSVKGVLGGGTCTTCGTYAYDGGTGAASCEQDSDDD